MKRRLGKSIVLILSVLMILNLIVGTSISVNSVEEKSVYDKMVDSSALLYVGRGGGSGVFIADNKLITAAHLFTTSGCDTALVELSNGSIRASIDIYLDEEHDIAIVTVDIEELSIAYAGDLPKLGDEVFVVGTPFSPEFKFSLTKGIVSHPSRDALDNTDLIQIDAYSAAGCSGGPMYNSAGELVGVMVGGVIDGGSFSFAKNITDVMEAYRASIENDCL